MPEVVKQLRQRAASYRQLAKTALTDEGRKVFSDLADSYDRAAKERSAGLEPPRDS
jgi:hypothetical protein